MLQMPMGIGILQKQVAMQVQVAHILTGTKMAML